MESANDPHVLAEERVVAVVNLAQRRVMSSVLTPCGTRMRCTSVRSGLSLKSIGDLLGHRTLETTCVYLRLAVDDLRDVALPLPAAADRSAPGVAS